MFKGNRVYQAIHTVFSLQNIKKNIQYRNRYVATLLCASILLFFIFTRYLTSYPSTLPVSYLINWVTIPALVILIFTQARSKKRYKIQTRQTQTLDNKFEKISRSGIIGLLSTRLDGSIFEANDAFLDMIGYDRSELEQGLVNWKQLSDPAYIEASNKAVKQLINYGVCQPFEKVYIHKDGSKVYTLVGSSLIGDADHKYAMSYVIDISETKKNELKAQYLDLQLRHQQEELIRIFMNAPVMISIWRGPELKLEFLNTAALDFQKSGQQPSTIPSEVLDQFKLYISPELLKSVYETGKSFKANSFPVEFANSGSVDIEKRWFDLTLELLKDTEGQVEGILSIAYEVTAHQRAQQAIQLLMEKKDEIFSIASHELKTPLTSLTATLQMLNKITVDQDGIKEVTTLKGLANKQVKRLSTIVNDLLDVTKIQSGEIQLNQEYFDLKELAIECISEAQLVKKNPAILLDCNLPALIFADRFRIEQVITNFISNAIKYSKPGNAVKVNILDEGQYVKCLVSDKGIGIPESQQPFIFDRFFRVHGSSQKYPGLGLGLYLAAEIIKKHGGAIGMTSELEEGSTFWFTIPIGKDGQ